MLKFGEKYKSITRQARTMTDKKTILIIDDEVNLVRLLKRRLEHGGYNVLTAYDGEEGLKMINEEKPDLVLLDINMPKMGGIEVYKRVSMENQNRPPILIFTARGKLGKFFKDIQADGFISKPFEPEELFRTIERILMPETFSLIFLVDCKINPLVEKIKTSFIKIGFRVEVIKSLYEFQKVASVNMPKYIIMEYTQTDMEFKDFIKKMKEILSSISEKSQPPLPQPSIIVYTYSDIELPSVEKSYYKKKCLEAGADEYIGDPKDGKAVVFALREYMLKKKVEREERGSD